MICMSRNRGGERSQTAVRTAPTRFLPMPNVTRVRHVRRRSHGPASQRECGKAAQRESDVPFFPRGEGRHRRTQERERGACAPRRRKRRKWKYSGNRRRCCAMTIAAVRGVGVRARLPPAQTRLNMFRAASFQTPSTVPAVLPAVRQTAMVEQAARGAAQPA